MTTVLILDDDVGFVLWLGEALSAAGYRPLPAPTVSEAVRLLHTFNLTVSLLIVNPSLSAAAGFIDECRAQQEHLRVMAVLDQAAGGEDAINRADVVKRKPGEQEDPSPSEWAEAVARALDSGVIKDS